MPKRSTRIFHAGRLVSQGDFCDYFETDANGTSALLKVVSDPEDNDLLDREAEILRELWSSPVEGTGHFTRYLPRLVAGTQMSDGRAVNVLASGEGTFDKYVSLDEIIRAYPNGYPKNPARHMIWQAKRLLEVLSWVHRNGFVHGGVLPPQIMYREKDHAGMLCNWCYATRLSAREKLPAKVAEYEAWYPEGMLGDRPPMPADDTAMLARCMIYSLGGNPLTGEIPDLALKDDKGGDPRPLFQLLRDMLPTAGLPRFPNTDELRHVFKETATRALGKAFVEFTMPVAH